MTARRILLLILDGISDRPCTALQGKTPLQAARTPVLDHLAETGICGIMDTIGPGIRPGSDTSHLALLGYPPEKYYTGRGPLEAEGTGIRMSRGMIGFRANYATQDPAGIITDRRAGRVHDTAPLSAAIEEGVDLSALGVTFRFVSGAGHRAALAFSGEGLGHCVSSNDPKKEGVSPPPVQPLTAHDADRKTAAAANEFIRQSAGILAGHPLNRERERQRLPPANIVLIRGAGEMGHFEPFSERYHLSGSVISAATLISGIGRVVGLEHIPVPGTTGSTKTDLMAKVAACRKELSRKEFVLMNIKGADEAGHDGDADGKRAFIKRIDGALAFIEDLDDCLVVICGDHSTPCEIRDHSADPVPIVIWGDGVRTDHVRSFDEIACAQGGLHRITGAAVMPIALDLINKAHKYGA
jgi:2,3-bisphosphoglycerate-independent phosphoglycerate mutase